jgi:hypothetical protein
VGAWPMAPTQRLWPAARCTGSVHGTTARVNRLACLPLRILRRHGYA